MYRKLVLVGDGRCIPECKSKWNQLFFLFEDTVNVSSYLMITVMTSEMCISSNSSSKTYPINPRFRNGSTSFDILAYKGPRTWLIFRTLTNVFLVDAGSGLATKEPPSAYVALEKRPSRSLSPHEAMDARSSCRIKVIQSASRRSTSRVSQTCVGDVVPESKVAPAL